MTTKERLTRSYILALGLFVALFVISQITFRLFLNEQDSDSKVINLSGRQRMLSQKISKAVLKVQEAESQEDWSRAQKELTAAHSLLSSTHLNLTNQSDSLGLNVNNSMTTLKLYDLLDPHYEAIDEAVQEIYRIDYQNFAQDSSTKEKLDKAAKQVLAHEKEFLPIMNTIVFTYDEEAKDRVKDLSKLEWTVLLAGLALAILSGLLIFRPMVRKVVQAEQDLQQNNEELRSTEEELRQNMEELSTTQTNLNNAYNQAQAQLVAINATVGYVEISPKRILIEANDQFASWLGYGKKEIIGRAHYELVPDIDAEREAYEEFWDRLEMGKTITSIFGRKHKDGHTIWLFASYTPVYDIEGRLMKVVKLAIDYTKQKKAEAALMETNNQLMATEEELRQNTEEIMAVNERLMEEKKKANDAIQKFQEAQNQLIQAEKMSSLGQLTAGIAHEINNPVNFIAAGTQTLRILINDIFDFFTTYHKLELKAMAHKPDFLEEELEEVKDKTEAVGDIHELQSDVEAMVRDVETGVERVVEVVRGLKNFSRADEGKKSMADLHESLDATLLILNNKSKDRVEIIREYDPNLPQVECYAGQIGQVFMNILNNAMDAIPRKGEIRITTKNVETEVEIKISDDGEGMPEAVRSRIFDPFYTTKAIGKGTGLGLSISHGIIEKHQGSIEVESELGKGTTFTIRIPKKLMYLETV